MGVPKFFRYISERYPCLVELLNEYQIPEFDNLYLDMNGIVHCCSHPNDADAHFRITEENIFKNIFQYIEILFNTIKPQKLFFMAVDGVAPRAKINQQRGRRFRAAKDAEAVEARARARGEEISKEPKFDSNCITPGTVFMAKLAEQLRYFVTWKISTNKLWQRCKVILSGPEVPGEGEHKIMDYIRYLKSQPDHDPDTRHCLYGLDADLIMLSLCTHEPHFTVLREEVKFGKSHKKNSTPEKTKFCLLHVSLLREYLGHEFAPIRKKLPFPFDIENIIDDWILMSFLVGNDFIPNLPNLHIENGALSVLHVAYMELLPTLDGYINEAGTLNLDRFEKFMVRLSSIDVERFAEHFADLKYFEGKTGRRPNEVERTSYGKSHGASPESSATSPTKTANPELSALIRCTDDMLLGHSDEEDPLDVDSDTEVYNMEFLQHKRDYYMNKLEYENVDAQVLRSQAEAYVTAIQWNLNYYYNGCCSWSWFYPHHYSPYISDIRDFRDFKIEFDLAEPFLPFQQLLAVLPAASRSLLPAAYRGLLTEEESPIIDYYPEDFKTDLNHKKQEWEAVVLIPFIDEKNLLDAMEPYNAKLTPEERRRNEHGPMCVITHTEDDLGSYEAPQYFPTIQSHAKIEYVDRGSIDVPPEKLVRGLAKGVRLDVYFAGFPTLWHVKHRASLEKAKVKVFEQPSRGENMILTISPSELPQLQAIAGVLLGQTVFVGWPHLREARVVGVSTSGRKIALMNKQHGNSTDNVHIEDLDANLSSQWRMQCNSVSEGYKSRYGVDVGDIGVLVYALPMIGRRYALTTHGKMSLEKTWAKHAVPYAHQAVVWDIAVHDPGYVLSRDIADVFTVKSVVFMLGHPHYGAMGEVIDPGVNVKTGRVKVAMRVTNEPILDGVKKRWVDSECQWMPTNIAAQRLGLSNHFLSRITGSIYVAQSGHGASESPKRNVGLNLKFTKRNEEVPGYTKKSFGQWFYSGKSIGLIRDYMQKYPLLFERLAKRVGNNTYTEDDLFESGPERLKEVVDWLKLQPYYAVDTRSCNVTGLDGDGIAALKSEIDRLAGCKNHDASKTVLMQVKPHLLYKPGLHSGILPPDPKAQHKLFDRIISVRDSSTVPLGYRGTIVGIEYVEDPTENVYDVFFDEEFVGGISFGGAGATNQRYKLHEAEFINVSYGMRAEMDMAAANAPGVIGNATAPIPPKSWRQDSRKQTTSVNKPSTAVAKPPYTVLPPFFSQNSKPSSSSAHVDSHQQIRVMKKNEAPTKSQQQQQQESFENRRKTKQSQNAPKSRGAKVAVESAGDVKNPTFNAEKPSQPTDRNSEFQILWKELHRQPSATTETPAPIHPSMPQPKKPHPPATSDSLQDESAFLKAMLKISDEYSSAPSAQPTVPVSNDKPNDSSAPPLVQRLFDHARQASRKENVSYCVTLLTFSQLTGRGIPRYNYLTNQQKMICAQITMPDLRTYCGEFCSSYGEAGESAAKVVWKELNLEAGIKPGVSLLGAPPTVWLNSPRNDAQPSCLNARPPPIVSPRTPQVYPHMLDQPIHVQRWIPHAQLRPPKFPQPPHPSVAQNARPTQNSTQVVPQCGSSDNAHTLNKPEQVKNKKSTPFVPLQAQKKTRNPRQTMHNQSGTSKGASNPSQSASQNQLETPPPQISKEKKLVGTEGKDSERKKSPQTSQKVQKAPRQRRSRIAANFNSTPTATNGGAPQ